MNSSDLNPQNIARSKKGFDIKYNRNGKSLFTLDQAKELINHWFKSGMTSRGYERKFGLTTNTLLRQRRRIKLEEATEDL
jgi:hypothetical protein